MTESDASPAAERKAWPQTIRNVGVIGLGDLGLSICRRLGDQRERLGVENVATFDDDASVMQGLGASEIAFCKSVAHLVDKVDIVLLCLTRDNAVAKVARAHEGLLDCVRQGQIIVDHTSSSLDLTRQLATAFAARGAAFLDAPVAMSGDVGTLVDAGRLTFAIGGDKAAVDAALPLLGCFADEIVRSGSSGAAQIVRQMGDLVALQTFAALAEALMTARAHGIDGDRLFDALSMGPGDNTGVGYHRLAEFLGTDTAPEGERMSIADAGRRLQSAIELARSKRLTLAGAGSTLALVERAIENGLGEKDLSGLFNMMQPGPRPTARDLRQRGGHGAQRREGQVRRADGRSRTGA